MDGVLILTVGGREGQMSLIRRESDGDVAWACRQHFFFFQKLDWVKITSHTSTWKNQTGVLKAIFPVKGSPAHL